jgi:hypothetical protein
VHERAVALASARLASRSGNLIAGTQLTATHLSGGDVDVAIALVETAETKEPVALARLLEHTPNLLGGGLRAALVAILSAAGAELDGTVGGVVQHRRLDHDLLRVVVCGRGLGLARLGRPTPPAATTQTAPARPLLGLLGGGAFARTVGATSLERCDKVLAAHPPVTVDPRCRGAVVEVGQVHLTQF